MESVKTTQTTESLDVIKNLVAATFSVQGDMAELGVWEGVSAKVIFQTGPHKKLHLFDTFSGMPFDDIWAKGHKKGDFPASLEQVKSFIGESNHVFYHVGVFPETANEVAECRFSFVHLDADLYQSIYDGIKFFWPRLNPGGILLLDDFNTDNCPGNRKAVQELIPGYNWTEFRHLGRPSAYIIKPTPELESCTSYYAKADWKNLKVFATRLHPCIEKYIWLSAALSGLGEYKEALDAVHQGLVLFPSYNGLKLHLSYIYNKMANWKAFYATHEYRFDVWPNLRESLSGLKLWTGKEDLGGKSICVLTEQGVGDNIQFMRFLPMLKNLEPSKVGVFCALALAPLMESQSYVDAVHTVKPPKHYDYYCSLLSLPYLLDLGFLPADPYVKYNIKANPKEMRKEDVNIGIVWAGNPAYSNDVYRSCPLKFFEPLVSECVKLWSLQVDKRLRAYWFDPTPVDLAAHSPEITIHDVEPYLKSFLDTVTWLNVLDCVISVDTATLHLAGAMGKKTIGLLPFNQCWRWPNGESTPWYPTMKLIRQASPGDWEGVMQRVKLAIQTER